MPTLLRLHGFRFYFFSHEPGEPPHVHVDKGGASAKYWLSPVALARNTGFAAHDLKSIRAIIEERQAFFLEKWNGRFGSTRG